MTATPLAGPGTYPVPQGRGQWRLTLHHRTYPPMNLSQPAPTWDQTILAELADARGRRLDQAWDSPAQLTFTVDGRTPAAAQIAELQHDIYAWRWDDQTGADICVFRGVIDHSEDQISEESHTVTFVCHDYLAVIARRFFLDPGQVVLANADQDYLAASALIPRAAGFGTGFVGENIPIGVCFVRPDGTTRPMSGTLRARTYAGNQNIGDALDDLAKVIGGFDYDIIPEPQAPDSQPAYNPSLSLTAPLGAGRDAIRIFFPGQGVTRTDLALVYGTTVAAVTRTVASSDYANYIRVLGNNGSSDPTATQLYSIQYNADAQGTTVGLWPQADNAADVNQQATLDQQALGDLALDGVLTPSYTLTMRPGAYTWGAPNMGDTVPLVVMSGRLQVNTSVRVVAISYDIGDDGQEDVTLTVGRPPQTLTKILAATQSDVNALARR